MTAITPNAGVRIDELWNDEGCSWQVRLDHGKWWTVVLDWWTEGGPHDANYSTLTWDFYDESLGTALADAVDWLEALAVWRPCPECDGTGKHVSMHPAWDEDPCRACGGSGLKNGSRSLAERHQQHYQTCNYLGDSAECCVPDCECHGNGSQRDAE